MHATGYRIASVQIAGSIMSNRYFRCIHGSLAIGWHSQDWVSTHAEEWQVATLKTVPQTGVHPVNLSAPDQTT